MTHSPHARAPEHQATSPHPSKPLSETQDWAQAVEECVRKMEGYFRRNGIEAQLPVTCGLDAIQEAARELLEHMHTGNIEPDERGIEGLLWKRSIQRLLDRIRRRRSHPLKPLEDAEHVLEQPPPQHQALEQERRRACAIRCVDELIGEVAERDDEKAIDWLEVMQKHHGDLKPRERAELLGWSSQCERNTSRRIKRCGDRLLKHLLQECES